MGSRLTLQGIEEEIMSESSNSIVDTLIALPIFQAE